jgi:hypothetical protein
VTAKEILIDGTVGAPGTAGELDRTLEKCSPTGGQAFDGLSATKWRPNESEVAFT